MTAAAGLRIDLLGPPLVEVDSVALAVDTRKATALLAYLALAGGPVRRDALTTLLWPDAAPERARSALRRTLSTLRAALGGRWLETDREVAVLDLDDAWLDVRELRRLLAECATHGHPAAEPCSRCLGPLRQAVALDRGPFLHGFGVRDSVEFDDWQQLVTQELRREVAVALERLAVALGAQGEAAEAIALARRRLALDPLHEPAHRELMRLLAAAGERGAALEQYRACVRLLDRELGVRPLDETSALYHAILEGTAPAPVSPAAREAPAVVDKEHPLVGRERELEMLRRSLEEVGPDGRLVAIAGEAGIGKTRLCAELVSLAHANGARVVAVRGFDGESGLAFGVAASLVREALAAATEVDVSGAWWRAEAARLVPELGPPPEAALDGPAAQARFYEANCALLTDCLTASGAGVLVVDDVHWADGATLGLLAYLLNRLPSRPLLIAVALRPEEVPSGHPIQRMLADARRARAGSVLSPGRLTTTDVATLVEDAGLDGAIAPRLHRESGGLPFFVVEVVDGLSRGEHSTGEWPLPAAVRDLLGTRVAVLGELDGQVLAAAAALGGTFDAETVRGTSGRSDDETVAALEELSSRGLLVERPDGSFDFRHEQLRELVYDDMTLARRRLLHRRAAAALGARGRRHEQPAAVARHLELAGDDLAAADRYRAAGDRARRLYANAEAAFHYRAALALGDPHVSKLQLALGDVETLRGEYGAAAAAYETAAANADETLLPDVEHRLGLLHLRRGAWELADAALASALERLPREAGARVLADQSLVAHRRGDADGAERLARESLELSERAGDTAAQAQAHNILGMLAAGRGDHDAAVAEAQRSLDLARSAGDREAEAAAANNLALALGRAGATDEAIVLTTTALQACTELGDRHREAALRSNLADLLHRDGRDEEAMVELKLAARLFAEIGEDGKLEPEIWKLTDW